ncbi:alpha/beta fold hydrolase [Mycolicibacterium litorale]|uniref:alpha/beta fold hydrolase n=1 Tax=Mycolicibacterium litorale TaxID=758802 RepID=UPI003CF58CA9
MTTAPTAACEDPWRSAYAVPPVTERVVTADGTGIAVSLWHGGDPRGHDVMLVHGGAAQRHWWDHLGPLLLHGTRKVVALDLSGHGDSDHREAYTIATWSGEVLHVAHTMCEGRRPILVGHSMGGLVAVDAAQRNPDAFTAVMALDSPLQRAEAAERRRKIASRPVKSYSSRDDAIEGYKTYPPVDAVPPQVWEHITRAAYRKVDDRWALRFDPRIYQRPQVSAEAIATARIPTWWIQAERGFVDDAMAQRIRTKLGPAGSIVRLPAATHHLLLEQPLAAAWLIRLFVNQHRHGTDGA